MNQEITKPDTGVAEGCRMSDSTSYSTVDEMISDRTRWALALLNRLIQRGRSDGWIDGEPRDVVIDPDALAEVIETKSASSPPEVHLHSLQWLSSRLQLGAPEEATLWLLASVEIAPAVARLVEAFGSNASPELTIQIVQQLIPISQRQLQALHDLGLVELTTDPNIPLHRRRIRVNDRVIDLIRGELEIDRELAGVAAVHPISKGRAPEPLVAAVRGGSMLVAIGPEGAGRATLLIAAAGQAGCGTLRVQTSRLARDTQQRNRQLKAIVREACLFNVVPLFEEIDADQPTRAAIESELRSFTGPVMASARESVRWADRAVVCYPIEKLGRDDRARCWSEELSGVSSEVISEVAERYTLRPGGIVAAAKNALATGDNSVEAVHAGVRAYLGEQIGTLATRVESRQTWRDLVLPSDQFGQIVELVARVRHRGKVLDTWGFGDKIGKGHGVAALLSGPPGTGKTMAAGLIAQELGLDLYQVDLSKIVSKYVGETEKQLATLFEVAESGQAVILFDEADSLFAKRSEVKSSNDRYANLEVNYLLQRMEAFTGISLLTTNHERAIDEAFRRRLALHVRFPMPEESQREQMWRVMIPAKASTRGDIDFARLGREFEMSGGYIKNAVLRAAYLAAHDDSGIAMEHLWHSAHVEYEAMGKIVQRYAA